VSIRFISGAIVLFLVAWAIWRGFLAIADSVTASSRISDRGLDASLVRITSGLVAIFVGLAVVFTGLRDLGVDAVPLIAGLGVGGLAVALAIRPTLENLIGGIILFTDKPIRVGDFCSFGSMTGTVEKIGVRSTQIRGLDRTLISIPNAKFADMELINWAQCDRMLISATIGLRYETEDDQLRHVLVKIREMLHAHPKIDRETVRVRFSGYGASSLDIGVRIYALTRDWNDFHAIREDVFFRIKAIVSASGTGFAFPSQTLYLGRDDGLDEDRAQHAVAEVARWRDTGELPFPRLRGRRMDELEGTLDYPPRGSVEIKEQKAQAAERLSADEVVATPSEEPK
jgi:MscS family membrane protein